MGLPDFDGSGAHSPFDEFRDAARVDCWIRGKLVALVAKNNGDGGRWPFLTLAVREAT